MGWMKNLLTGSANAREFVAYPLGKERSDLIGDAPLESGRGYFRIWLRSVFLAKRLHWFRDVQPAVHTTVKVRYAGRDDVELSRVLRPPDGCTDNAILTDLPI